MISMGSMDSVHSMEPSDSMNLCHEVNRLHKGHGLREHAGREGSAPGKKHIREGEPCTPTLHKPSSHHACHQTQHQKE